MDENMNNEPEVNFMTRWSPDGLTDSASQFEALSGCGPVEDEIRHEISSLIKSSRGANSLFVNQIELLNKGEVNLNEVLRRALSPAISTSMLVQNLSTQAGEQNVNSHLVSFAKNIPPLHKERQTG